MRNFTFRDFKVAGISLLLLLLSISGSAQVNVTANQSAAVLAQKLTGPGVVVLNPVLTCALAANGIFSVTSSNLGIDSGIVLTSGHAKTVGTSYGVNGPASDFVSNPNGNPGDAQLLALAQTSSTSITQTKDACILQFDFVPAGDTVKFQYVFGSEEYTSFTCSNFNDVFGFFISGPGFSSATNIALVPGTNIPVAVNSVNNGPTGGYSITNCNAMGPGSPFSAYYVNNSSGTTITYDGITTVLTAIANVTPCDTYHLKLGVADANDDAYDSGVFIRAGSLTSPGVAITPVGVSGSVASVPYCVRGCSPGKFVLALPAPHATPFTLHYEIAGTAVNGYDYVQIPDSITIPAGDSIDSVVINALNVTPTGPKIVQLLILAPYNCNGQADIIDSAQLTIYDSFYVQILNPDTSICLGQSVNIVAQGDSFLTYTWTPANTVTNQQQMSATVTPVVTTTYAVSANLPGAGCQPSHDEVTVTVYQPPTIDVGGPYNICVGTPIQFNVTATAPVVQTYTYSWSPTTYLNNDSIPNPVDTPHVIQDQDYTITVNTAIPNCGSSASLHLHVLPNDFQLVNQDTAICVGAGVQVTVNGSSEFAYLWTPPTGVSDVHIPDPFITPPVTDTYTVTATYTGCPDMVHSFVIDVVQPTPTIPIIKATCVGIPVQFDVTGAGNVDYYYSWTPGTFLNDTSIATPTATPTYTGDFTYVASVRPVLAGCYTYDTVKLHVVPNDFSLLTPDTTICIGATVHINASGSNEFTYTWTPSTYVSDTSVINPDITPLDTTAYTITATYPGCPDMVHGLTISVENPHVQILTADTAFCIFQPVQLAAEIAPTSLNYTYSWSPSYAISNTADLQPQFFADEPGTYHYTLTATTDIGCITTDTINITAWPPVKLTVSPLDTIINYGDAITLNTTNYYSDPLFYFWTPDNATLNNPNIGNPVATPLDSTHYHVVAMNQYGCSDSGDAHIYINYAMQEFLPSAFTPNGDGINDQLHVLNLKYQKLLDFRVFNRWGQVVYSSNDATKGWDGTFNGAAQDIGDYNYMIIIARPDGTERQYKGTVTLIR